MAYAPRRGENAPGFFVYRSILPNNSKNSKRPLDDDFVLQPIYSASRKRANTEPKEWLSSPVAQFAGIGSDDLPYAPDETTNSALLHYVELPVHRKLEWRLDDYGKPKRRDLFCIKSLVAAFAQTRGDLAKVPCTACEEGKGPWKTCVAGSDMRDGDLIKTCANCRFSGRPGCTLKESEDNASVEVSELPSTPPRDTQGYEPQSPSLTPQAASIRLDTSASPLLFPRASEIESGSSTDNTDSTVIKIEAENPPVAPRRVPSRHDGKLIPFPLDPSMFNDLSLLKVASADLAAHFSLVERRVNQLEEEELKKKDIVNPWDLL
ncbi:DUF3716 domain-containing protein [Aspergillus mulundensis]|uniref:Uncharacterized protein n=1 Tax=Aspergillus mulundensis TaxID=1810919 RepID=A0A3D8RYU8_9EURO|nr:hypothetical protein DSM5745_06075 [Aspergillus mulundensis]RDW79223.1 hypothetical protein DSM5745_06075 [Aspergillus mulundensis]